MRLLLNAQLSASDWEVEDPFPDNTAPNGISEEAGPFAMPYSSCITFLAKGSAATMPYSEELVDTPCLWCRRRLRAGRSGAFLVDTSLTSGYYINNCLYHRGVNVQYEPGGDTVCSIVFPKLFSGDVLMSGTDSLSTLPA